MIRMHCFPLLGFASLVATTCAFQSRITTTGHSEQHLRSALSVLPPTFVLADAAVDVLNGALEQIIDADAIANLFQADPSLAAAASVAVVAFSGLVATQFGENDEKSYPDSLSRGKPLAEKSYLDSLTKGEPFTVENSRNVVNTASASMSADQSFSAEKSRSVDTFPAAPSPSPPSNKQDRKPPPSPQKPEMKKNKFNPVQSLVPPTNAKAPALPDKEPVVKADRTSVDSDTDILESEKQVLAAFDDGDRGGLLQSLSRMASSVRISRRKLKTESSLRAEAEQLLVQAAEDIREMEDKYELEQNSLQKVSRSLASTQQELGESQRQLRVTSEKLQELEQERQSLRKLARQAVSLSNDRFRDRLRRLQAVIRRTKKDVEEGGAEE